MINSQSMRGVASRMISSRERLVSESACGMKSSARSVDRLRQLGPVRPLAALDLDVGSHDGAAVLAGERLDCSALGLEPLNRSRPGARC
jgi:hypothetical protein